MYVQFILLVHVFHYDIYGTLNIYYFDKFGTRCSKSRNFGTLVVEQIKYSLKVSIQDHDRY